MAAQGVLSIGTRSRGGDGDEQEHYKSGIGAVDEASLEQPAGHYRNGVNGVVSDADGNAFDLSAFVNFPLTGEEQGPPDFIRHDVSLTPVPG